MNTMRLLTLVGLVFCMFNALICSYSAGIICMVVLIASTLAYRPTISWKILLHTGIILGTIALLMAGLPHGPWVYWSIPTAICLLAALLIRLAEKYPQERLLGIILLFGAGWCLMHSSLPSLLLQQTQSRSLAYLERGHWGISQSHDNSLVIRSQYSYDMVKKIIGSRDIPNLSRLEAYTDLWMITPTQPFSSQEIEKIRKWVLKGGRLVVITDHTDLFGHASVLNPLLESMGLRIQKDCILDSTGDGGTYQNLFQKFKGLSANSFSGRGETWLVENGYSERTDYSKNSFFSDNQISDEEIPGIYPIGLTSPFGLGNIVLFGDSTLFANFALSRPSAQHLLQKVADAGPPLPFHTGTAMMLLLFWSVSRKRKIKILAGMISFLLLIAMVIQLCRPAYKLSYAFSPILNVWGDWSLAENDHAKYSTLFATAFSKSPMFPVWKETSRNSNRIVFSNGYTLENSVSKEWLPDPSWEKRLNMNPSLSMEQFMTALNHDSWLSSFWFDDGVGLLKNKAYEQFWKQVAQVESKKENLKLSLMKQVKGTLNFNGITVPVTVKLFHIQGHHPWVILGDWIIGKEISSGMILIRSNWQHPSWGDKDAVFQYIP